MRVLKEGTRLADRYTLRRRLGAGGRSRVWLAHDRRAGAEVVLKFLPADGEGDAAGRDRLQKEWRIGSRLMHPHIARVFEFHDDPDGAFYARQYIAGPDAGVLAGEPPEEVLRPFGLIADALRYAHGKGTIHRDIKAANILLDSRGAPYLIDFGAAATLGEGPMTGGTPVASSPQQRAGEPPAPSDDIFALGVLLHETLTGAPPGDAAETAAPGAMVPAPIAGLLRDMLAPEPARRPDAASVGERLRDAGIDPGPAPARLTGGRDAGDTFVPVETVSVARRAPAAPAPAAATAHGVRPAVAWGGLALLVAVSVGVFVWLPGALQEDRSGESEAVDARQTEAVPAADSGEAAGPAAPAAPDESRKAATDEILGELLSKLERLKLRGIERWGGQSWLEAQELYRQGDRAYLDGDYRRAGEQYRATIRKVDPFFGRIDSTFRDTLAKAEAAFARGDPSEAVRLYDLAVAITPGHQGAREGLARARNLETVLALTDQGIRLEKNLELQPARKALEGALELDPAWQPAREALARVKDAILERTFEQRMTEGLEALAAGNYPSARAAFNAARDLRPGSRQPVDGLQQVDQEVRLNAIRRLEQEASELEEEERWQDAVTKYQEILEVDGDLQFAREGLTNARERAAIHERLQEFVSSPDALGKPATMKAATDLLLRVTRITPAGPRLTDQKNELSRLLKRAATPLTVQLVSDNETEVSIYQVGYLGTFARQQIDLRPGAYVALGSREGFRDVRLEFRVAPEIDMEPIVIVCEERI